MSWSQEQRSARRARGGQVDMFDRDVLELDPWLGDRAGWRLVQDRFVVTRRLHFCCWCEAAIGAGSRVRARAEVLCATQALLTAYFCDECSDALKGAHKQGCTALYARRKGRHRQSEGLPIQDGRPSAIVRRPGRSATSAGGPR